MSNLPTISVVIPTYNEERNIGRCLEAIFGQTYSKDLLEVIVVDNHSEDATVEIARKYDVKILYNEIKDPEVSKMVGLRQARGQLFLYLDADIEMVGKNWLHQITKPMMNDPQITGAFPRFAPKKTDCAIGRYLRYHPLELDPVLRFFCTEINETIVAQRDNYSLCQFNPPRIPPIGICVYRRKQLLCAIGHHEKFMDIDVPVILAKLGYNRFAYVRKCLIYHVNVGTLKELVTRRLRNVNSVFLPSLSQREFIYFTGSNWERVARVILLVLYTNLLFPALLAGIMKSVTYRDYALLYEPIVALVLTDVIIYGFLRSSEGRNFIKGFPRRWKME